MQESTIHAVIRSNLLCISPIENIFIENIFKTNKLAVNETDVIGRLVAIGEKQEITYQGSSITFQDIHIQMQE